MDGAPSQQHHDPSACASCQLSAVTQPLFSHLPLPTQLPQNRLPCQAGRGAPPLTVLAVVAVITWGAGADVAAGADVVACLPVLAAPVLAGR